MDIGAYERHLVSIMPSERQLKHQKLEFYGFFHFTVNTYTDREWGDGTEDPAIFHPEKFDADQWAAAAASAGMRGAILTCKHHDGFCLWPSKYTDHTVAASPFRDGNGDVVREVSDALCRHGLKFGVYLSPWDRHQLSYGKGAEYDDYFVGQLTELLTGYGDIFCVWLDGACGEGANGKVQKYDWNRYYEVIRRLQPEANICVCGPDVRWCGNEAGDTREQEWSIVPERLKDKERIQAASQQSDDTGFREKKISTTDQDLGSRAALEGETELAWYPAEVDLSIRPGWFYHESEDNAVRSLENLVSVYDKSVGGNAMLLLNVPPTREGLLHETDVQRLKELGDYLREREAQNLAKTAVIAAVTESFAKDAEGIDMTEKRLGIAENLREDDGETYFKTPDGVKSCTITFTWDTPVRVSMIVLKEDIRFSQRVESFCIVDGDTGNVLYEGHTIGYRKNALFAPVETKRIRVEIAESRVAPVMSFVGIY